MCRSIAVFLMVSLLALSGAVTSAQEPGASPEPEWQRVEVPEAGMALTFPGDWSVVVQMVRHSAELPAALGASDPVDLWVVVQAGAPDGSGCELLMYGEHPLGFGEHAEWIGDNLESQDATISMMTASVDLPVGEAVRFDIATADEGVWTAYLFEAQETRYQLRCSDVVRHEDDWLSVATTLEALAFEPLDLSRPEETSLGERADVVLDFDTVVSVVRPENPDFPVASLMNADCAFALWVPADDGSAREWLACTLNETPMDVAEYQGVPPAETITETGGECIWRSDYWYQTDRRQIAASAYELTVTPGGQVFGWSDYPAEPLDCPD